MPATTIAKKRTLETLQKERNACSACASGEGVTHYVFGRGNPDAELLLVGEAPGFNEDRTGLPFVGRAGQLLDSLLRAAGLDPGDLYITNVVKCRPMRDPSRPVVPGNDRPPTKKEIDACLPVLKEQIAIIAPGIVCTLGNTPFRALCRSREPLGRQHGRFFVCDGIRIFPTYHPASVFHKPLLRQMLLDDFRTLTAALNGSSRRR
jgi:DNA polymerase